MKRQEVGQSPDEVFDVVDSQDQVIGSAYRRDIHRQRLLHRAVHIFWLRADGQLCLQRRSFAKDNCPGLLSSSCAGHVDTGEDYLTAAIRELREELGAHSKPGGLQEIDYAPQHAELGHEFVRSYLLRGDYSVALAHDEVDSLLWRTPAEVLDWSERSPAIFAMPLIHLLRRKGVRLALGLPA
ncbi:MAG: NUDIX domain-containing protein [Verrucomicrobiota bacterium]|jgi:isopentenyl-diphosphate delta-isomerase type 1